MYILVLMIKDESAKIIKNKMHRNWTLNPLLIKITKLRKPAIKRIGYFLLFHGIYEDCAINKDENEAHILQKKIV